jgi:hypothetical protein
MHDTWFQAWNGHAMAATYACSPAPHVHAPALHASHVHHRGQKLVRGGWLG